MKILPQELSLTVNLDESVAHLDWITTAGNTASSFVIPFCREQKRKMTSVIRDEKVVDHERESWNVSKG